MICEFGTFNIDGCLFLEQCTTFVSDVRLMTSCQFTSDSVFWPRGRHGHLCVVVCIVVDYFSELPASSKRNCMNEAVEPTTNVNWPYTGCS